jgi:uncharacterized protein (TIGR02231 family)
MMIPMQARMPPRQAMMAEICESDDEVLSTCAPEGTMPWTTMDTTEIKNGAGGSATFTIQRRSTIDSDNKEHKVTVTIIQLTPKLRYFCTPALEERAYLQANAINTSEFPLLESHRVAIFFDGSFVTTTHLKHTSPGESINVFLGVDSNVKITHRLISSKSQTGREARLFHGKKMSGMVYEYATQIYNTKPSSVDITVVCLLPRASDDKIDVQLIQPPKESLFKGTTDAVSELGNSATGEGQLASGSVMQNKITNNIVFSRTLKAQEKVNLPFSYSMQWPPEAGNEVQIC